MPTPFDWPNSTPEHTHVYLLPAILSFCPPLGAGVRVLDVGCGNGSMAGEFINRGCDVVGIDLSESGIRIARQNYPRARFEILAADDRILSNLGEQPFDIVLSTEVVEHLYDPYLYAKGCFAATRPGGRFICSTPFHGYLKNLMLSLTGSWDKHASPLWQGGHIKLWSVKTLSALLNESGFRDIQFKGAGRFAYLWKSMVLCAFAPKDGLQQH